jgi:hypothetical protein
MRVMVLPAPGGGGTVNGYENIVFSDGSELWWKCIGAYTQNVASALSEVNDEENNRTACGVVKDVLGNRLHAILVEDADDQDRGDLKGLTCRLIVPQDFCDTFEPANTFHAPTRGA